MPQEPKQAKVLGLHLVPETQYSADMTTHDLDATGLLCPLPVLKLRKRLSALEAGDQIAMRADDPAAIIDVPHFCSEAGHALVETTDEGAVQVYLVRKGG